MRKDVEQEEKVRNYLEEYERLTLLFQKDKLFFELECKRIIEENIASWPDKQIRENLLSLHKRWDKILCNVGSNHNDNDSAIITKFSWI